MVGFFNNLLMFNFRCNFVGIFFKKDGGWRLIINLFVFIGNSVNDFIDFVLCLVLYVFFD